MNDIAICIPTYKRPALLKGLILSIIKYDIDKTLVKNISIIIVDNDIQKTAESTVSELQNTVGDTVKIIYDNYAVKGLSNVRNQLIKLALKEDPTYLLFIDDDEFVTSEWLSEMVKTIQINKGDMVMGPVDSKLDDSVPDYISTWFKRPDHENNSRVYFIRSGNLIINAKFLQDSDLRFDSRFNSTGGEDSYFGIQMIKKGATIYWAANAVAYEIVPADRSRISWLFQRYYNGANIFTYILTVEKLRFKVVKKALVSILYIGIGLISLPLILLPLKRRYWGLFKMAEGFGGISGLLAIRYNEYK